MSRIPSLLTLAALTATLAMGCDYYGGGEMPVLDSAVGGSPSPPPSPSAPPQVQSIVPADGATGVPLSAGVTITFSQSMDPATITTANLTLSRAAGPVAAGVQLAPDQTTTTITPVSPLAGSTAYTVTVTTGATSASGLPMAADFTSSFTTGADIDSTPPTFAGATGATATGGSTINVQWAAASDNVTPAGQIVYRLYAATASGAQNFSTPTATTAPGATSFVLTGLMGNTTYFIVVRAQDSSGNVDSNANQVNATTNAPRSYLTHVWPVLNAKCVRCHKSGGDRPFWDTASLAYTNSVNVDAKNPDPAWKIVKPFSSAWSTMYDRCTPANLSGGFMPESGTPLTATELSNMRAWIDEGALNN
ncbi:MAG: Ig-like domain-containing protein [Planctomycetes bacterium]|nr:Ig-like domain-containing protein [Planctomycetota bacterium]